MWEEVRPSGILEPPASPTPCFWATMIQNRPLSLCIPAKMDCTLTGPNNLGHKPLQQQAKTNPLSLEHTIPWEFVIVTVKSLTQ